eukprot:GAHX01000827.1.p1 GENE.GAHX01000827.1~~GAHX01000827.1.p1  ORF type:complete len:319 (+),score=50.58 GAHX01000827.1:373-1329(+)
MENPYNPFVANKSQTNTSRQGSPTTNPFNSQLYQNRYYRIPSADGIDSRTSYSTPANQIPDIRGKRAFTLSYHQNTSHLPNLIETLKERTGKKGKSLWTPDEDTVLQTMIGNTTNINWKKVAFALPNRNSKQCRERWKNHVDPKINNSSLTEIEKSLILSLQSKIGNKWSIIAVKLKNRTENMVKNFYYLHKRRMKKKEVSNVQEIRAEVEEGLDNSYLAIPKLHVDGFPNESLSDIDMPNHELYSSGHDFKLPNGSPRPNNTVANCKKEASNPAYKESMNEIPENCTFECKKDSDKELYNTRFETKRLIKKMFDSEL